MGVERFGQNAFTGSVLPRIEFSVQNEPGSSGGPSFATYRGTNEIRFHGLGRNFTNFDASVRLVYPKMPPLDAIIGGQIDHARRAGGNVVVIDLGGGLGNFTRQALTNPNVLGRSRKALAGKSATTEVKFYSVNDSPTAHDHSVITQFTEADMPGNERLSAQEVNYSITTTQSFKKLLEALKESSANLVVASSFLMYLRPPLFKAVIQDIIDGLAPGGQMLAVAYAQIAGQHLSIDDGYAEEDYPVDFIDPAVPGGLVVSGDTLRSRGFALVADETATDRQLRAEIRRLQEIMVAAVPSSNPDCEFVQNQMRREHRAAFLDGAKPRPYLEKLLREKLPSSEDAVRIGTITDEKDAILEDLRKQNTEVATIDHHRVSAFKGGEEVIVIKKKIGGKRKKERERKAEEAAEQT